MRDPAAERAGFDEMRHGTVEEWRRIVAAEDAWHARRPGGRLLDLLASYRHADSLGFPINVYAHSLQAATRALRDGADEETIVVALLHDVADLLVPTNHGEVAAALLGPYVRPENAWLLANHPEFQRAHFGDKVGLDARSWERHRGHPAFEATVQFCERWDQASFAASYDALPLEAFEPLVARVFARPWAADAP